MAVNERSRISWQDQLAGSVGGDQLVAISWWRSVGGDQLVAISWWR
jgi:hypothetical protein